uniref:Innexin n=1 Tax=Globodera rostochiensis TaxID=31243 RepID=A0A914HEB0_GLORO
MGSTFGLGTSLLERLKKSRENDDWVDRFVYWVSPCVIILLAVIIGAKQFVGQPIQCWAPNEFKGQWMSYAESYCFVENTYFVSMREQFPMREIDREQREIIYYQWMSFLLFGQALLLMAPKFLWEAFNWKSGLNINVLVRKAHTRNKAGTREAMEEASRQLGTCIHGVLQQNARAKAQLDFSSSFGRLVPDHVDWKSVRPTHSFVSFHYILFKLLNLCSALVQLYLLNCFMVPANYTYWGFDVLRDLMAGRDWSRSGLFPRVTFCDFKIRQAAQHLPHQRFTLQCVIMINMFNEKVFIFLWFWLLGIVLLTAFNLLLWLYRIFSNKSAKAFIVKHLRLANAIQYPDLDEHVPNFVRVLSYDGLVVLRLIHLNTGDIELSSKTVAHLWHQYLDGVKIAKLKMVNNRQCGADTLQNPNFEQKSNGVCYKEKRI